MGPMLAPWTLLSGQISYVFTLSDLKELDRVDTMLMSLLPDKLKSRLEGCMIDIDDLKFDEELGKGTFSMAYI